jgi:SAM-dependent methyltransferase
MIDQSLNRALAFLSKCLRGFSHRPVRWPAIQDEMAEYLPLFVGEVLNAGAGHRDLQPYIPGRLTNQDLPAGGHNANIHIYSPLHSIPRPDGHFDVIVCNAVLEHVANPDEVLAEFHRVLRPGGHLYLGVPFMQPEHLDPTDFQRYTQDGLKRLVEKHGFAVERLEPLHSVYHTLGWIVHLWLTSRKSVVYWALRQVLYPAILLAQRRRPQNQVAAIASAYRVWARKGPTSAGISGSADAPPKALAEPRDVSSVDA